MLRRLTAGVAALCVATVASAAQPQFWKIEGARDFLEGDTEGLSVDSEGRVRLAPAARRAARPGGAVGLGPRARRAGARSTRPPATRGACSASRAPAPAPPSTTPPSSRSTPSRWTRTAASSPAASPDGKVYLLDRAGRGTTFFDPDDKYIWALALDGQGRLLVATGSEGKVHRRRPRGQGRGPPLRPRGAHHRAGHRRRGQRVRGQLARRGPVPHRPRGKDLRPPRLPLPRGQGAAGGRGRQPLRGGHRRPRPRRVRQGAAGDAARRRRRPLPLRSARSRSPRASASARRLPAITPSPRPLESARTSALKGAVLRVLPSGEIDTLWSSTEEMPHSLVVEPGGVLVGTGNKGHALPDPRRSHLDHARVLPRRAGHEPAAHRVRGGVSRHVEPGPHPRPGGGAGARGHLRLQGEGHRDHLDVGPRALGRRDAPGDPHRGHEPQRQHGHARRDVDRVVQGLRPPGGRAGRRASARASCS